MIQQDVSIYPLKDSRAVLPTLGRWETRRQFGSLVVDGPGMDPAHDGMDDLCRGQSDPSPKKTLFGLVRDLHILAPIQGVFSIRGERFSTRLLGFSLISLSPLPMS